MSGGGHGVLEEALARVFAQKRNGPRMLRLRILRLLVERGPMRFSEIHSSLGEEVAKSTLEAALEALSEEIEGGARLVLKDGQGRYWPTALARYLVAVIGLAGRLAPSRPLGELATAALEPSREAQALAAVGYRPRERAVASELRVFTGTAGRVLRLVNEARLARRAIIEVRPRGSGGSTTSHSARRTC